MRAVDAMRTPSGRFAPGKKEKSPETNGPEEYSADEPASSTVNNAGDAPQEEVSKRGAGPKTHRSRLMRDMGISQPTSSRDKKILDAFSEEQLGSLGRYGLTKKQLTLLAKIKEKEKRNIAVNKVLMGIPLEKILADAETDIDSETVKRRQEDQLDDSTWVKTFCSKPLKSIQHQAGFIDSAIGYRKLRGELAMFSGRARKLAEQIHYRGPTPFTWAILSVVCMQHPNSWTICGACLGLNKEVPNCPECKGHGFHLNIEWPSRRK
jgi:hypothetical protein